MQYLFTGLLTVIAVLVVYWAYRAQSDRLACERAVRRVEAMRGRLITLEASVDSLDRSHRKLSGKFHAEMHRSSGEMEERIDAAQQLDVNRQELAGVIACDNFKIAQIDGPTSPAASCECDYCTRQRELRRAIKAQLMPKGQGARIEAMKRGLGQPT